MGLYKSNEGSAQPIGRISLLVFLVSLLERLRGIIDFFFLEKKGGGDEKTKI